MSWVTPGGDLQARATPTTPRTADLRLRQYQLVTSPHECLARASRVVQAKLHNASAVVQGIQSNMSSEPLLTHARQALRQLHTRAGSAGSTEELLGMEGLGARAYFDALPLAFRVGIPFEGRHRRPPPDDPANALLSFTYSLLANLLAGLVEARGLDPSLGFFHVPQAGRPSLVLDMIEELRHPIADRFVMRVCNLKTLRPEHFEPDPENPPGVKLNKQGQFTFMTEWEKYLLRPLQDVEARDTAILPRDLMLRQVNRMAADIRGTESYRPFMLPY